ncbi:hypothetical protein G6F37_004157 [Rhizopus arrhizus]|nr:hypothetical protein G6F38_004683 [Rhizopus arrhizus]KAG1160254.1 hypothetical protein G6F37_004157 [Rhizopus arrhizus]
MELVQFLDKSYRETLEKLLPILQKKSKWSYISAAALLITIQQIYSYLHVPKKFRHIPSVSSLAMAMSFLSHESQADRFKRIIQPVVSKGNGTYVSKIPISWTVYVASPVIAKHILLKSDMYPKSHDNFKMAGPNSPLLQFMGLGNVVFANGHTWKTQRKLMNPVFHRSMPVKMMSSVLLTLFSVIEKENGTIPIAEAMKNFTLDVLGYTIFDFDFKALNGDPDGWTRTYHLVNEALDDPILNVFPSMGALLLVISPVKRRRMAAIDKLNRKFDEMAQKKRREIQKGSYSNKPDSEKDLLTLMLEAENNGEGLLSDTELRQNLATFFLAGHETTANSLSFAFYYLAQNKHVQQKLREEVISIFGDEPTDVAPTLEQLKQMSYLDLVIKETLRIAGPVDRIVPRVVLEDMVVGGTLIPKGSSVNIDLYAIHHNTNFWKNPDQFIPERFAEGGEQESHEGLTWLPFGNGARQCIGMNFSLAEQRIMLALMVRKYIIDIPKDSIHYDHVVFDCTETKAPKSLELTFTKRH